jgi:hypothetical protein
LFDKGYFARRRSLIIIELPRGMAAASDPRMDGHAAVW